MLRHEINIENARKETIQLQNFLKTVFFSRDFFNFQLKAQEISKGESF
jgi:hypothetical protein